MIGHLHAHLSGEQKAGVTRKYSQMVVLFFQAMRNEKENARELKSVTIMQDMMKSLSFLLQKYFQLEQYVPIQFYVELEKQRALVVEGLGGIPREIDAACNNKNLMLYRDAIIVNSERLVKDLYFRKMMLDCAVLEHGGKTFTVEDKNQLELLANEIYISQAHQIKELLDIACTFNMQSSDRFDSKTKNVLLEVLIEKYFTIKDIDNAEMKKKSLTDVQPKVEKKPQNIFEREDIKQILEMVQAMGFSQRVAQKAIKRIEIPEPTMIIDYILQGKISDDDDEPEDPSKDPDQPEEPLLQEHQQLNQDDQLADNDFIQLLKAHFHYDDKSLKQRGDLLIDHFKDHLDHLLAHQLQVSFQELSIQPLNNYSAHQQSVELLLRLSNKNYNEIILNQAHNNLKNAFDLPIDQMLTQLSMGLGQLNQVKKIYPSAYKQFVQEQQLSNIAIQVLVRLKHDLLQQLHNEHQFILNSKSTDEVNALIQQNNKLFEKKQVVLEALFTELNQNIELIKQFLEGECEIQKMIIQNY